MTPTSSSIPENQRKKLLRVATDLCYCSERLEQARKREGKLPTKPPGELHDTERELLAPLLDDGFEIVGTGAGRCVLRFPENATLSDHVVKLARFGDDPTNIGIMQNHREVVCWTRHGETGQWPLLPVTDHHERYRWLMMPYGKSLSDRSEDERSELVRQVQRRLVKLPEFDVREARAENIVLVEGEPLMADYGRPDGY